AESIEGTPAFIDRIAEATPVRCGWSDRGRRNGARDRRPHDRGTAGNRSTRGRVAPPAPADRVALALGPRDRAASRSRASGGPGAATAPAGDAGRACRTR